MPDPTLSQAIMEAHASADPDTPEIDTLSIYYAGLVDDAGQPAELYLWSGENPTRIAADGTPQLDARLEITAARNAGQIVTFLGVPFEITPPDVTTDPQTSASLAVDNIKQEMIDLLIAATQAASAIEVTYRSFLVGAELDGPENDPPIQFNLVDVSASNGRIEGRLVTRTIGAQRFPRETYTPARFRTLVYA